MKFKYVLLFIIMNYGTTCFGSESHSEIFSGKQKEMMLQYLIAAVQHTDKAIHCKAIEGVATDEALDGLVYDAIQQDHPRLKELREAKNLFTYVSALHKKTGEIRLKAFTKEQYWKSNPHVPGFEIKISATGELVFESNPFYRGY